MIISFDFDDTLGETICFEGHDLILPISKWTNALREHYKNADDCYIVTARFDTYENKAEIRQFLKENYLEHTIKDIICTNHNLKGEYCNRIGVRLHYDDDIDHINDCKEYGIECILTKS